MRLNKIVEMRVVLLLVILPYGIKLSNSSVIHPPSSIFNAQTADLKFINESIGLERSATNIKKRKSNTIVACFDSE
jgi:hypothetical protein